MVLRLGCKLASTSTPQAAWECNASEQAHSKQPSPSATTAAPTHLAGRYKAVALHIHGLRLAKAGHAGLGGGQRNLAQHGKALERAAHNVVHLQQCGAARTCQPRA